MADRQIIHPTLGISRVNGQTDTCSKCGHTIPDEHVPLIIWSDNGHLMWCYCEKCEEAVATTFLARAR